MRLSYSSWKKELDMKRTFGLVISLILLSSVLSASETRLHPLASPEEVSAEDDDNSVYLVYYWRAKPGKFSEYSEYIRNVAEPIDEEARKAGVFEECHTYTQAIATGAPGADWTHIRIFRLKNFASWDDFSAGLDEATRKVFPDEVKRRELMAPAAGLRDLLRQEIWRGFP
jgi:hypothetical protein